MQAPLGSPRLGPPPPPSSTTRCGRIGELVPKVTADYARQDAALSSKAEADAALLLEVVELIKPALPAISGKLPGGNNERGFLLVEGKGETALYEDGTLDEEALWLVRHFWACSSTRTTRRRSAPRSPCSCSCRGTASASSTAGSRGCSPTGR